jgi:outer membrane biosynthesis protein TonB
VLPGRLGFRFALEALFLVLLAIGAGLADLSAGFIVLVMAVAWLLVAIVEFTAERIAAAPLTYLLPERSEAPADEPEARWPMPEERTIVAPLEQPAAEAEPAPEPEPEPEPEAEEPVEANDPEPPEEEEPAAPRRGLRSRLRRRRQDDDPEPATPPRHVKLLPRRSAPQEESRAAQEVAEIFDEPHDPEEQSG